MLNINELKHKKGHTTYISFMFLCLGKKTTAKWTVLVFCSKQAKEKHTFE